MSHKFGKFKSEHEKICYYCGAELSDDILTVDHKTPSSRGGTNKASNLEMCCERCNKDKANMLEGEYMEYLKIKNEKKDFFVNISEIFIPYLFRESGVKEEKVIKAIDYYNKNGRFDKPITLKDRLLIDGYSRLVAAQRLKIQQVPVNYGYIAYQRKPITKGIIRKCYIIKNNPSTDMSCS